MALGGMSRFYTKSAQVSELALRQARGHPSGRLACQNTFSCYNLIGELANQMARSPEKFAQILTEAIYKIRIQESRTVKKTLGIVQDELGYALGREGGSSVEYWRKGHIPADTEDVEQLARELVKRCGLNRTELEQFLVSAGHPASERLVDELFSSSPLEEFAPFIVGPPITHPRQFFGRERELKRVFSLLRRFPLQNVAVVGLHRSGKTSFLHYVERITQAVPTELRPGQRTDWLPQSDNYQWVFVDFQNSQMRNKERLLQYLLTRLNMPVPDPCELNSFIDVVSQYLQAPTVILMDEIGAGLASPELDQSFWWSLRSLGSNYTNGKLAFILTAHELPALLAQEHDKPSPFFNIFGHTLKLGPLSDEAARELIASSPRPFSPADTEWILAQSGRWPVLLQILGNTCLTALEEGQTSSAWREEGLRNLLPFQYLLETG